MTRDILSIKPVVETAIELPANGVYKTTRNGISKTVHVVNAKGDVVFIKEALDRVDSQKIPLAKFNKFYCKVA